MPTPSLGETFFMKASIPSQVVQSMTFLYSRRHFSHMRPPTEVTYRMVPPRSMRRTRYSSVMYLLAMKLTVKVVQ